MNYLSLDKGIVAIRCWYYTDYQTSEYYDCVCVIVRNKQVLISLDDGYRIADELQRVSQYGEPAVIGVNNYLEYCSNDSWNEYLYADSDKVRIGNDSNAVSIDLRAFIQVLRRACSNPNGVRCYYDKTDLIYLRFWDDGNCQFYLKRDGELYFVPLCDPNDVTSSVMSNLVQCNEDIRDALGLKGRLSSERYY